MKYKLFLVILSILILSSCSLIKGNDSRLDTNTSVLLHTFSVDSNYKIVLLEVNFHKTRLLTETEAQDITEFFKYLGIKNFLSKPMPDAPAEPQFKYFISFNSSKYVMEVYNSNFVKLYPWDGTGTADYIKMNSIPKAYNLYSLGKYYIPQY